jgi:hypothetical protein
MQVLKQDWLVDPSGMVTKGNKKFAGSAEIRKEAPRRAIARRAFIYQPERVIRADFEVVRDTGFEPVTPTVSV